MAEKSLKDTIYDRVLEGIFNYDYKPNQILTEQDLVNRYGCSKAPVREALISLCNDGVLRNIPRCGYEVVRITSEDVDEIQHYRRILECGILKRYYSKITHKQLEKLRTLNNACSCPKTMFEHWECISAFHLQLMLYSKNHYAYQELQRAMNVLRRAYAQFYWDRWDETSPPLDTRNHIKIINALEKGNIDEAVQALDYDLNDFCVLTNEEA